MDSSALYPKDPPSSLIRKALTVRAQLLSSTYLLQTRLVKINKPNDPTCQLCKNEEETVNHFVASCSMLNTIRADFVSLITNTLMDYPDALSCFDPSHPSVFTSATLIPIIPGIPSSIRNSLLLKSLFFIYKIHMFRLNTIDQKPNAD